MLWYTFSHPCLHQIYQSHGCRKTNLQKGKRKKKKREKNYHIPHLKGRSKHWDMLLTQRYMLAHIPLTKINILASVLTFTSFFSSHLNHYNHCIYSSLPSITPCCVHTLPSASTSFLSRNRAQEPFISLRG